jgi:hypothetical protein
MSDLILVPGPCQWREQAQASLHAFGLPKPPVLLGPEVWVTRWGSG